MKLKSNLLVVFFFYFFVLVGNSFALDPLTMAECGGLGPGISKIYSYTDGRTCASAASAACDAAHVIYTSDLGFGSCCPAVVKVGDCSLIMVYYYCSGGLDCVGQMSNVEESVAADGVVSGVPAGNEASAAKTYADTWHAANPYPSVTGKVRTDGARGFAYTVTLGSDGVTGDVDVKVWKRGVYTSSTASPIPLGDLSGSGSGGLSKSDTTDAVASGVGGVITGLELLHSDSNSLISGQSTGNGLLGDMKNLLTDIKAGQGTGVTTVNGIADLTTAVGTSNIKLDDIKNSLVSDSNTSLPPSGSQNYGSGPNGTPDDPTQGMTDTDSTRNGNNILSGFKNSSFVGSINALFDADLTKINLSNESCSFQAPAPFGHGSNITFSLCSLEGVFSSMGTALMGLAGFGIIFFIFE